MNDVFKVFILLMFTWSVDGEGKGGWSHRYRPYECSRYINSDSAVSGEVGLQEDMAVSSPSHAIHSVLPLRLVVRRQHIGKDGRIRLKCTAGVLDLYWRTAEQVAQVVRLDRNSWSLPFSSSPPTTSCPQLNLLLLLLHLLHRPFSKTTSSSYFDLLLLCILLFDRLPISHCIMAGHKI